MKIVKIVMFKMIIWYFLTKNIAHYVLICYNQRRIVKIMKKERRGGYCMNIGIIAHNSKKTLIEDFCIAYKGILAKHDVYATGTTGRRIEEVTTLRVHKFLPGTVGGDKQFMAMIERNAMDMVILFHNPNMTDVNTKEPNVYEIVACCDQYNIPVATNIATAETLILGLSRGDLEWREYLK